MESLLGFQVGFWDYATLIVLAIIGAAGLGVAVFVLGLPGRIAIARKHPDAEAVYLMGWIGFLAVVPSHHRWRARRDRRGHRGALYLAYPLQVFTLAGLTRNYLVSWSAPPGTITTESNAGYKAGPAASTVRQIPGSRIWSISQEGRRICVGSA